MFCFSNRCRIEVWYPTLKSHTAKLDVFGTFRCSLYRASARAMALNCSPLGRFKRRWEVSRNENGYRPPPASVVHPLIETIFFIRTRTRYYFLSNRHIFRRSNVVCYSRSTVVASSPSLNCTYKARVLRPHLEFISWNHPARRAALLAALLREIEPGNTGFKLAIC